MTISLEKFTFSYRNHTIILIDYPGICCSMDNKADLNAVEIYESVMSNELDAIIYVQKANESSLHNSIIANWKYIYSDFKKDSEKN